ncbi:MAG: NADH-quinone oxidoreductase subunit F [Ignavibacteriae bacterium HGW-Ignavibacteriae-2]|jgi:NADH:ubiquinone oxidoreductase subunit F (NADH-binding)/(2Fe-2S) ferredoxin|nr:4Fe-4S binding protein [Bacteroidota bacterium]PKL88560.1 MAG: NADH-quinone oxidoreductase subunit F [Ignavibacteriae bacterium HGW-Ignavibacteriae-2]
MKSFLEIKFKNGFHSPENPVEEFVAHCTNPSLSPEQHSEIESYISQLKYVSHDVPLIFIGMDTSGLASGGGKVKIAIEDELSNLNIVAKVIPTGGIGYGSIEPVVDIKLPGQDRIIYGDISPKDVPALLKTTLIDNKIYEKKVYATYGKTDGKLLNLSETPFFKHQDRVVLKNLGKISPDSIDEYIATGGFKGMDKAIRLMSSSEVVKEVLDSGLRGRGGGGFPTGKKWELALKQKSDKKYIICNADEGDPGAFMDRSVLEGDPFQLVEGMIIGAYAIGASYGYIYCRAEYPLAIQKINNAIYECRKYGFLGNNILNSGFNFDLKIKKGAGAFVCGEETALIASIEGERGMPRPRPPYPSVAGLWGKPTVINNVETFANVATILNNGSKWFSSIGTETSKGTKVFALSGKITNTGLVEVPMGVTLRKIVFDIGGGIPNGKKFKALQIGGPSGGCLPENIMDTHVDYESLKEVGAMMGSGGFVVMDEDTCMVDVAKYFLTFIQNESCGKCVPCREGTKRMLEIVERISRNYTKTGDNIDALHRFKGIIHLKRLAEVIKDTSLCGLGQSAPNPILSGLHYFKDEYDEHIFDRKCDAKVCKELLTYSIIEDKCSGCGLCARVCSSEAIAGNKKQPHLIIESKCIKCGMCVETCRFDAIAVN